MQIIRDNPDEIINKLKVKNFNASELVHSILELDSQIRLDKKALDENLMQQNTIAKRSDNYSDWKNKRKPMN